MSTATTATASTAILYHANCIDGWFSAYLTHQHLIYDGDKPHRMIAITPSCPNTIPGPQELAGQHIMMVDVSVDAEIRARWMEGGALSIECVDHHEAAHVHWPAGESPIDTHECTAMQLGRRFTCDKVMPEWLQAIDRVDRWDHPTHEDRCLREMFLRIAHLPGQGKEAQALQETSTFIELWDNAEKRADFIRCGEVILRQKEEALLAEFAAGRLVTVDKVSQTAWGLPSSWVGVRVFLLDTTHVTIDSTEAAHVAFQNYPDAEVFINYRRKTFRSKSASRRSNNMIVYSARSRGFSLTGDGSMFNGHSASAGASVLVSGAKAMPFFPL